ncbi:hypothetical protein LTR15_012551 [Elasticomyces elasticus]|nr:hypothetical protein LTR15_012551 [Elasticomyces elasticus]
MADYFGGHDNSSLSKKASTITMSSLQDHSPDETSPLLPSTPRTATNVTQSRYWLSRKQLTLVLILLVILASSGDQIQESPQTRICESVMCYHYYEDTDPTKLLLDRSSVGPGAIGGVEEAYCKVNAVQEQLAMLRGYQQLLDGLPSLLLALPFGWAADRYGRRPILALGLLSFVLRFVWIQVVLWYWQAFDIRMTWLSTLHACLGGGSAVISGVFFVVLSDITPEDERAGVFLRAGASSLLANFFMPPLSAWLMTINPWIPMFMGTMIYIISLGAMPFIPETLGYHDPSARAGSYPRTPVTEHTPAPPPDMASAQVPISADFAARWAGRLKDAASFLSDDWRVPTLILPFFGHMLIGTASQLLLQYMSKRYEISFADATLLLSVYNGVKVLLLFVLLPYLSTLVMRSFRLSGQKKDLYLARASQLCVVVGYTLVGMSPNIPTGVISLAIASLGSGAYLLLRSFITSLVPSHHVARVYSIITLVDTIGAMFGSAIMAGLFKRGLAIGSLGLPFYFLGLISAVFLILMCVVGLRPGEDEKHTSDT